MFQSIRPNSPVYIFYKGENPRLEIGYANASPTVKPKYSMPPSFGQQQEMVVDISVKLNSEVCNFSGLPANMEVADAVCKNESVIISDNKTAMNSEILSLKQKSIDIVKSGPYHKAFADKCDKILTELNPEFAEKEAQKKEIDDLKSKVETMSAGLKELIDSNRKLMEQISQKTITL